MKHLYKKVWLFICYPWTRAVKAFTNFSVARFVCTVFRLIGESVTGNITWWFTSPRCNITTTIAHWFEVIIHVINFCKMPVVHGNFSLDENLINVAIRINNELNLPTDWWFFYWSNCIFRYKRILFWGLLLCK